MSDDPIVDPILDVIERDDTGEPESTLPTRILAALRDLGYEVVPSPSWGERPQLVDCSGVTTSPPAVNYSTPSTPWRGWNGRE